MWSNPHEPAFQKFNPVTIFFHIVPFFYVACHHLILPLCYFLNHNRVIDAILLLLLFFFFFKILNCLFEICGIDSETSRLFVCFSVTPFHSLHSSKFCLQLARASSTLLLLLLSTQQQIDR